MRRRFPTIAAGVCLVVALAACEPFPTSGRYSTPQYAAAEVDVVANVQYGSATRLGGQQVDLLLDLYLPPDDGPGPRPVVVLVHGGGFVGGNRGQMAAAALSYARLGFVAASISYRLEPDADFSNQLVYFAAVQNAIDDGMESVRWLRSQAATYHLDTDRIAMVGSSAGGAVALGTGMLDDPTPGGPLAAHSPRIGAAVSTGAMLTPGIELGLVTAEPTDAPSLLFHYEVDTVTGFTDEDAAAHCDALVAVDVRCRLEISAGSGHTVGLGASGSRWTGVIGVFLWNNLTLWAAD